MTAREDYEVWVEDVDENPETGDLEPIEYNHGAGRPWTLEEATEEAHYMAGTHRGARVKLNGRTVRKFEGLA